ncbi:MAG: FRG domain-containing protein [Anaerolineales bacterium]|nr:FRG domain-containing protein [Anaerolineales bacterium]
MKISKREINSVKNLLDAIKFLDRKFHHQIWWRGQRDFSWGLKPSIFRPAKSREYSIDDERGRILRFQQRAISRHGNLPALYDWPGWLFIMQHYRLPTRLLDWTESPMIALFFASEIYESHQRHQEKIPDADGAIFALSPYKLNEDQIKSKNLLMPEHIKFQKAMGPAFTAVAEEFEKVIAVRPSELDIRLMVQLSVFTINGYEISIDRLPSSDNYLWKFKVPKESKESIRKELKRLGIRLSNIFPDLDHLSEELSHITFKPSNKIPDPKTKFYPGNSREEESDSDDPTNIVIPPLC